MSGPLLMPPITEPRRRKSTDGQIANTKPLRSSPLAGPALNRSPATSALTVSSNEPTDDPPPMPSGSHVLHPKSSLNLDSCDSNPTTPRQRGLGSPGSGRCKSLHIPSTSSLDTGHLSPSLKAQASEWEIDPLQSLSVSRTPVRPRPASHNPSFRPPIPIVEEEPDSHVEQIDPSNSQDTSRNSSTSEFTNSRAPSQPQADSWYTANTYDVTPRFSRLGLSSSTVVMPLSAKEHRRLSRRSTTTLSKMMSSTTNSSTPSLPSKRFFIPSLTSKPSTITQVSLQPPPPPLPSQMPSNHPPLSRTLSNTSSSETSNSQCETPTAVTSASSPSLTRSRSSEDSISTWNDSLPPATPSYLVHMPLPDGAEYERDKRAVDGDIVKRVDDGEFRGHHDRDGDHGKMLHYSDITITIKSASEDHENRPDQVLMTTELRRPQPTLVHHQLPPPLPPLPQPLPQPTTTTTNIPFPAFPKDVKKERSTLRKRLVRIKFCIRCS